MSFGNGLSESVEQAVSLRRDHREGLGVLALISERGKKMKTNSQRRNRRIWLGAAFTATLLLLASSQSAIAQQWTTTNNDISNTNTGNVGVGTTTPTSKLTVQSTGPDYAGETYLRIKNTNSFTGLLLDPGQTGDVKWLLMGGFPNAGDFTIREYGVANYLTVKKTTGNVGIGTTNPTKSLLHIKGVGTNYAGTPTYTGIAVEATDATKYVSVDYVNDLGFAGAPQYQTGLFGSNHATASSRNYGFLFNNTSNGGILFATQSLERMRIDNVGNVGIGTSAPSAKLHLFAGSNSAVQFLFEGGSPEFWYKRTNTVTLPDGLFRYTIGADGSFYLQRNTAVGGDFGTSTNPFIITKTDNAIFGGNVGIGVSPSYKLDVSGVIRATGGFRFPDNTVQASAATMTGVTAGAGLTGGGTSGAATLDIGAGTGVTVAADSISVNYGSTSGTAVQGNTSITVSAGDGMSGGGLLTLGAGGTLTLTNTDKGSSQSIFKNVANDLGQTQFSAGSPTTINNNDTIRFAGSGGTTITFDSPNKKVIIDGSTSTPSAANISAGQFGQNTGGGNYTFPGNVTVNGNIAAKYQDVAEWVPTSEQLPTGTVVVLDSTRSNQVISSTQAYDTRVAGVISEQPGIALGESGAGKVLVATTGRVLVNVDATNSPIHIGDLLVTSDVPGLAMKSEPVNLGGVQLHRPGTLIGKALEPLEKGKGKILVLLSLQ
jgi:hypothetical protein